MQLRSYMLSLFLISFLAQFIVLHFGGLDGSKFRQLTPLIMYIPAIVTINFIILSKNSLKKSILWRLPKAKYLLQALLVPLLICALTIFIITLFGWGELSHFDVVSSEVLVKKGHFILGKGVQSIPFFLLNFALTILGFSFLSAVLAFGEEIAWRGYLQGKLVAKNGTFKGILLVGIIWGFWHLPYNLAGYNYPENPILGAFLLFPLTTVFASFFLGWLTLNSKSVWPAVLGHAFVNTIIGTLVGGMNYSNRFKAELTLLTIWGITSIISYALIKPLNYEKPA